MKQSANRSRAQCALLGATLLSALLTVLPVAAQTTQSGLRKGISTSSSGGYGSGSSGMSGNSNSGMSGAMPGMLQPANSGMNFNGSGASPNANGTTPNSNPNGMSMTGSKPAKPAKAAHLLKKIKPAHAAPALPNQYTDYTWGGSSAYNTSKLYAPTWSAPQAEYTWGATLP